MSHPIFNEFRGWSGPRPANISIDWIGARFLGHWDKQPDIPACNPYAPPVPEINEEYFEWVDILESVKAASGRYVMAELGAGYGRWGIRAGIAAMQAGLKDIHLVFAEAEPQHCAWIREAVKMNGVAQFSSFFDVAVNYEGKPVPFLISYEDLKADNWWGQCIAWESGATEIEGETYHGRQVYRTPAGYKQVYVTPGVVEEVLAGHKRIDLVDMDLQRAEQDVMRHSMPILNQTVKRIHIGTHAPEIEDELRVAFQKAGWRIVWDFKCNSLNQTPYGPVEFVDGIQSWINTKID